MLFLYQIVSFVVASRSPVVQNTTVIRFSVLFIFKLRYAQDTKL